MLALIGVCEVSYSFHYLIKLSYLYRKTRAPVTSYSDVMSQLFIYLYPPIHIFSYLYITGILEHLFKHSEGTCSDVISLGGLDTVLFECRKNDIETLRHCAGALANLALYGGKLKK